jgi:predicted Zn finger-like uncharacterized protein
MPIDFACPECQRHYRVKDELAGKGAKCGQCGHRMQIPAAAAAAAPSNATPSAKSATSAQPVKQAPKAVATARHAPAASSWLDEELEGSQPAVAAPPKTTAPSCPSCGAALAANAVLCISCGYDLRTQAKHETRHAIDTGDKSSEGSKKPRGKLAGAASLLRGTVFSFIAAIVGAAIWAGLAVLTEREFGLVAWALGGLVGFGMALGHDDDDGTFAGIIAAFMSLFGIIAAKILIIVLVVAPAVAAILGEIENLDPVEAQREFAAMAIAEESLREAGVEPDEATDDQWNNAMDAAKVEVAGLSEEELTKRMEQIDGQDQMAGEAAGQLAADDDAADEPAAPGEDAGATGLLALFFASMFSPIDGIFVLLAFFTAYKVGSGKLTD